MTLRRPWVQICKAAGLSDVFTLQGKRRTITRSKPKVRIHDLRHTAATLLLQEGVNPKVVQELLGHSRVAITLDIYSHVSPHMRSDAGEKIDARLRKALADSRRPP